MPSTRECGSGVVCWDRWVWRRRRLAVGGVTGEQEYVGVVVFCILDNMSDRSICRCVCSRSSFVATVVLVQVVVRSLCFRAVIEIKTFFFSQR